MSSNSSCSRVHIATDHAGMELSAHLVRHLAAKGYEVVDNGPKLYDRQHNEANVVALGGRQHTVDDATALIEAFLQEPFSEDERHLHRIGKIADYETTGAVPE